MTNKEIDDLNNRLNQLISMSKEAARLLRCGCEMTCVLQLDRTIREAQQIRDTIETHLELACSYGP